MKKIMQIGTARRCVTPDVPVSLAGYSNARMWNKILDDIFVTAIVFKQDDNYAAIVSCDLISITYTLAEKIYGEISKFSDLSRQNLVITATHSHTAPEIRSHKKGFNADYLNFLERQIIESIKGSLVDMRPCELCFGETQDSRFCFNRRYWMNDGQVLTNPGKQNINIKAAEGDIDPLIPILGANIDGKLKVLIANISNHSDTIGGNGVSSDWNCFLRQRMENSMGKDSIFIPLISPSGNINHFDVRSSQKQTCYEEAERVGNGYADSIEKILTDLKPIPDFVLTANNQEVKVGPREISDEELENALKISEKYSKFDLRESEKYLTSEDLARKTPEALKHFADGFISASNDKAIRNFNLVGIRMGDFYILSLPSEPFVEIGLRIRNELAPSKITILATHSGSGAEHLGGGYIPNSYNFGRGGYELTAKANPFAQEASVKILDGIRSLLVKLDN